MRAWSGVRRGGVEGINDGRDFLSFVGVIRVRERNFFIRFGNRGEYSWIKCKNDVALVGDGV